MKDLLIFDVDFNELDPDEGRWVVASREHASSWRVPKIGEVVWLRDSEGIEAPGVVYRVWQRTLLVEPEWDQALSVPVASSGYVAPSNTQVTIDSLTGVATS